MRRHLGCDRVAEEGMLRSRAAEQRAMLAASEEEIAKTRLPAISSSVTTKPEKRVVYLDSMRIRQFACDLAILGFVLGA